MPKAIVKTIILVALVVLSIYQIAMLWFDYPSDRNFFYSIIDSESSLTEPNENEGFELFYPIRVATYQGISSNYELMELSSNDGVDIAANGLAVIRSAFIKGRHDNEYIREEELWDKQHVLLELPFTFEYKIINNNLNVDSSWLTETMSFDRVYIYPAQFADEYMKVIFADKTLDKRFACTILIDDIKVLNEAMVKYNDQDNTIGKATNKILYASTKQKHLNMFNEDLLLPINGQYYDLLKNLYGDMYFYDGIKRNKEAIEEFVNYFFANPEVAWNTETSEVIRFGDLEVVVSYDDTGLFVYELIEEMDIKETSLNNAYVVASEFLKRDTILNQIEYELAGYQVNDEGVTYYYDYYYRGIPIIFGNMYKDYGQYYPMEITVNSSTVKSYKRLLWKSQEVVIQGNPFEVRYQKPLDFLLSIEGNDVKIDKMYLGYYNLTISDGAYLQWIIELPNGRRAYELE